MRVTLAVTPSSGEEENFHERAKSVSGIKQFAPDNATPLGKCWRILEIAPRVGL